MAIGHLDHVLIGIVVVVRPRHRVLHGSVPFPLPLGCKAVRRPSQASPPALHAVVIDAFARALHVAFLWGIPVAAIGFIVVLFLREEPLKESAHIGFEAE